MDGNGGAKLDYLPGDVLFLRALVLEHFVASFMGNRPVFVFSLRLHLSLGLIPTFSRLYLSLILTLIFSSPHFGLNLILTCSRLRINPILFTPLSDPINNKSRLTLDLIFQPCYS